MKHNFQLKQNIIFKNMISSCIASYLHNSNDKHTWLKYNLISVYRTQTFWGLCTLTNFQMWQNWTFVVKTMTQRLHDYCNIWKWHESSWWFNSLPHTRRTLLLLCDSDQAPKVQPTQCFSHHVTSSTLI